MTTQEGRMLKFTINNATIRIIDFEFISPVLVEHLKQIDPSEQANYLTEAIEFGLSTLATVSTQSEIRELESTARRVRQDLAKTKDEVIGGLRQQFNDQLNEASQTSLISVFKRAVLAEIKNELSPDSPNSPFAGIAESMEEILKALDRKQERKRVESKTAIKGNVFQADVDAIVKQVGVKHGDQVEFVGSDGAGNRQPGDTLVTFNPQLTTLRNPFKVIWEYKTQTDFKGSNGILKTSKVTFELDEAIRFREADCGIFVADSEGLSNQPEFQEFNGNKLIIVLDRDNPDERLVTLAYLWSKGIAYRMNNDDSAFDFGKLGNLLTRLRASVESISRLKASHTEVENGLSNAKKWVETKEGEFKSLVVDIEDLMSQKSTNHDETESE